MNSNSKSSPDLKESEMVPLPSPHFSGNIGDIIMSTTDEMPTTCQKLPVCYLI